MSLPDPIYAAIQAASDAREHHIATLVDLNEDDDAQMRRANAAADRDTAAWNVLAMVTPTTMAGLRALLRYYAACYDRDEPSSMAGDQFERLATVLDQCDSGLVLASLERLAA